MSLIVPISVASVRLQYNYAQDPYTLSFASSPFPSLRIPAFSSFYYIFCTSRPLSFVNSARHTLTSTSATSFAFLYCYTECGSAPIAMQPTHFFVLHWEGFFGTKVASLRHCIITHTTARPSIVFYTTTALRAYDLHTTAEYRPNIPFNSAIFVINLMS